MEVSSITKSKSTPEKKARRKQLLRLMKGARFLSIMEDIRELFKDMIVTFVNQELEGELD